LAGLAFHYAEAGEQERARRYYVRAGDHAWRLVALGDAAENYRAALERWPDAEQSVRAETLRKLLECLLITGHLPEALEVYEESRAVFETVGDQGESGAVQRLVGRIFWQLGKREESLGHYHNALQLLDDGSESVELARAVSEISRMHMVAAEYDKAIATGERALALAERLGAEDVTIHALTNIGASLVSCGDPDRGLAMLQDSLRRALALGLPYDADRAYTNLGSGFQKRSHYSKARATYVELLAYAERVGATLSVLSALVELATVDWLSGQWAAALARRAQILESVTNLPVPGVNGIRASTLFGRMLTELGQAEAARAELESSLSGARNAAELEPTVPHLGQLAWAYAALGMDSEAAATVQEIVSWIDRSSHVHHRNTMPLLYACQWSIARAGDEGFGDAFGFLRRLERAHEQESSTETDACLSEGRGSLALAEGDHQEAVGLFRHAVARWDEIGRPYDQARALSGLGRALDGLEDPKAAGAAFGQALDLYDSLAAQLEDVELKQSFLNSQPVRQVREARAALQSDA
jgi:tetratricopeptide (TPR) repeat protein